MRHSPLLLMLTKERPRACIMCASSTGTPRKTAQSSLKVPLASGAELRRVRSAADDAAEEQRRGTAGKEA